MRIQTIIATSTLATLLSLSAAVQAEDMVTTTSKQENSANPVMDSTENAPAPDANPGKLKATDAPKPVVQNKPQAMGANQPGHMPMMHGNRPGGMPMMGGGNRTGNMPMMRGYPVGMMPMMVGGNQGGMMPMMMGSNQGGMPMMKMMQQKQAMMKNHMKIMETRLANIEALLQQLVELQKAK